MDLNSPTTLSAAAKLPPLLAALQRAEELSAGLTLRLDPIVNHVPSQDKPPYPSTVTGRLTQLGDVLQYLLENCEL